MLLITPEMDAKKSSSSHFFVDFDFLEGQHHINQKADVDDAIDSVPDPVLIGSIDKSNLQRHHNCHVNENEGNPEVPSHLTGLVGQDDAYSFLREQAFFEILLLVFAVERDVRNLFVNGLFEK